MPDWRAIMHTRLTAAGLALDPDLPTIVEEIAQHAEEVTRAQRLAGRSEPEVLAAVEAELQDLPALVAAARRDRRARLPAAPDTVTRGRARVLANFLRDVVHGLRLLLARPAFTAIAVLTLALGIGANTAIFSVVHALFLAPLPFPNPQQLVMVWEASDGNREDRMIVSAPNWQDWRRLSTSFETLAIWETLVYNIAGGADPEQVSGMRASASLFPLLGIAPQLGRTFTADEEQPGHHVVVITDALWRRRFAASPQAIGQTMRLNGEPYEVIGVMPPSFQFVQRQFQVWVPIAFNENDASRDSHSFFAAGRLKPGLAFASAREEIEALGRRLDAERPQGDGADKGDGVTITPMADFGVANLRPTLTALLAAVGLVLLIACVNVANLLLAQATARQREFTIRAALGASRARIASQLLAEGLLLAVAGGAAGLLLAWTATTAMGGSLPGSISRAPFRDAGGVPINAPVLFFTCGLALVTGILFSLAPMIGMSRADAGAALKSGERGSSGRFTLVRTALVGIEVALAVIVLAAAGLMIKSVAQLVAVSPGLDAQHVLLLDVALPQPDFYGVPIRTTFCDDVQREVRPLPGVRAVAAMSHIPFEGNAGRGFGIEGRAEPAPGQGASANYRLTCPGYFSTMGIPLVRGRDFTATDATTAPGVVIINEETARRYWPDADPVGHRIRVGSPTAPWLTVVGVVGNVRHFGLDNAARREIYRPYTQAAWPTMAIVVKTAGEPLALAASVRSALARIDPDQPVSRVRTMERVVTDSVGGRRFPMQLLGLFSLVALILAAIGVYGVVSYLVSQRTREIGIRVALGARRAQVIRLIVRRSLTPIALGLGVGVAGAIGASRLLGTLLYEVRPWDPTVLGAIVAILGTAAVVASWVPARRAASVDPSVVLRQE